MTTRPLSPTLRARPRRSAALGVWHVKADELKGSPGLYRLVQLVLLHQVDPDVVYGLPNSESISIRAPPPFLRAPGHQAHRHSSNPSSANLVTISSGRRHPFPASVRSTSSGPLAALIEAGHRSPLFRQCGDET